MTERLDTKNLTDISDGLMAQFKRLENHEMDEFELKGEYIRATAMTRIAKELNNVAKIQFQASLMYPALGGPKPPAIIGHE